MRTGSLLSITNLFSTALLFLLVTPLPAQEPNSYDQARALYDKALEAFAGNNYGTAAQLFASVDSYLEKYPSGKMNFDHHYRSFSLRDLVLERQRLEPVSPRYSHRILGVFVEQTELTVEGIKISTSFTADLEKSATLSLAVCGKYVETLSAGKASLTFETLRLPATIRGISGEKFIQGSVSSIDPYPTEIMACTAQEFDTVIFFYNTGPKQQVGNSFFTAAAGFYGVNIVPDFLTGPRRGVLSISSALANRPGTLFHELFHIFEVFHGITPGHGYAEENRSWFPDWTGTGEFDYYRYWYKKIYNDAAPQDFSPLKKYPLELSPPQLANFLERVSVMTPADRKNWNDLYKEIFAIDSKSPRIPELGDKLLSHFPENADVLLKLGKYHHFNGDKKQSFAFINRAYQSRPKHYETCYFMGVAHYHQGRYEEADRYLGEAVTLINNPSSALWYRAWMHYITKNYPKAERDFMLVIRATPEGFNWVRDFLEPRSKSGDVQAKDMLERIIAAIKN